MNCRKCGRELRIGAKRCPYCGTAVPAPGSEAGREFKWNLQGSSDPDPGRSAKQAAAKKPRKIEWNTEKRENSAAGNTVRKKENNWKEPEEVHQLFTFDKKHEELQKQVNRKVDAIAAEKPAPAVQKDRRDDLFVLPEKMTMEDYSDLLGSTIVQEGDDVLIVDEGIKNEKPVLIRQSSENRSPDIYTAYPEKPDEPGSVSRSRQDAIAEKTAGQAVQNAQSSWQRAENKRRQRSKADQEYDPFREQGLLHMGEIRTVPTFLSDRKKGSSVLNSGDNKNRSEKNDFFSSVKEEAPSGSFLEDLGSAEVFSVKTEKAKGSATWIDPGYTLEEEQEAVKKFQMLVSAEEEFFEKVNSFTFMSEEEGEKAEGAYRRRQELSVEPDLAYGSLEEEFLQYRKDNNIPAAAPFPGKKDLINAQNAKPIIPPSAEDASAADAEEKKKKPAGKAAEKETARNGKTASLPADGAEKKAEEAPLKPVEAAASDTVDDKEVPEAAGLMTEASGDASSEDLSAGQKKPRGLNIKINEPSGTQFRVRTEEVALSDEYQNLRNTQQVDLGQVREGPKSVKVQIEVNHSASNSSVEVTRRADGAMVVRTEDAETGSGHTYSAGLEDQLLDESEKSFWEKSSLPASRMTLTDIIGEETQAFRRDWEEEEEKRRAEGLETVVHAPELSFADREENEMEEFEQFLDRELPDIDNDEDVLTAGEAPAEEKETDGAAEPETEGTAEKEEAEPAAVEETAEESAEPEAEETAEKEEAEPAAVEETAEESAEAEAEETAEKEEAEPAAVEETAEESAEAEAEETAEKEEAEPAAVEETAEESAEAEAEETAEKEEAESAAVEETAEESAEAEAEETAEKKEEKPEETPDKTEEKTGEGKQFEDLTTVISPEELEKRLEKETAEKDDNSVQIDGKGHKKRAGRIRFKYNKPEDSLPEDENPEKASEEGRSGESAISEAADGTGDRQKQSDSPDHLKGKIAGIFGREDEDKDTEKGRKDSLRENGSGELPDLSTEEDIEEEEGSSWDAARIMRMVIVVLIVAIVIEFAVIGVKLFAPNSQGAVFINRIEQSLSGEEAAYLSAPHLSGEEDSIVMDQ